MVGEPVSPVSMISVLTDHLFMTSASHSLSAVLIARLMLNMHEVADTDGMTIGEVASEESLSVEWNTIDDDSIPMEQMGGHMWNRASWGHGSHLE